MIPRLVEHVPPLVVLKYAQFHFDSDEEADAFFDWRDAYAAEQLERERAGYGRRGPGGAILGPNGWELPRNELNPRVIEHDPKPLTWAEAEEERQVQAEVAAVRAGHEAAVLFEDMATFSRQWRATLLEGAARAIDLSWRDGWIRRRIEELPQPVRERLRRVAERRQLVTASKP